VIQRSALAVPVAAAVRGLARRPVSGGLLLAVLLALALAGAASAHANLVRSDPASGAVLATAPTQIQLWFSEQPDPHFSDIQVLDTNRQRVDTADMHVALGDQLSLIIGVKPGIPDGLYTVAWKTVSAVDGHLVNGNFPFYVGQPPQGTVLPSAAQAGPVSNGSTPTVATTLVRWLGLLGAVVLLGGFAFLPLILVPALRDIFAPSPGPGAMAAATGALPDSALESLPATIAAARRRMVPLLGVAWLMLLITTLVAALQQAETASGAGLRTAIGAPLRTLLLSTRFGETWWIRLAMTALAGVGLLLLARAIQRGGRTGLACAIGAAGAGGVLLSFSLNSHAAALTSLSTVATASDLLHATAAGLWIGGLVQLALTLPACLDAVDETDRTRLLSVLIPRFSILATICVVSLLGTGVYQAIRELPTLDALWLSAWGRTLIVKLVLVVPLLLLGATNLLIARPALARAAASADGNSRGRGLRRRFIAAVAAESLLGVAILFVVGILVNQPPPAVAAPAPGIHLSSSAEGVNVKLTVDPGAIGPNHFDATVDVRGKPPPAGTQLVLRLTYADADLGTSELPTQSLGNGRYSADSSDLSSYGRWQILALVQPPSADEVRTDFNLALSHSGSSGAGNEAKGDTSVAKGRQLFMANCAECHGNDAKGDGPLAKQLDPPPANLIDHVPQHNDQQLLDWIANGIPTTAMPGFASKLSPADREAVLNYLRDLTKNVTPTPTPAGTP
jgi:copper transport protein